MLILFSLYTFIFWLAGAAAFKLFLKAIEPGEILDQVFNWQAMLARLYASPKQWKNNLGKALGDCPTCASLWFNVFWFTLYYAFCRLVLHYFVTDEADSIGGKILVLIIWMCVYNTLGWALGLFILLIKNNKKKKKDAV